jgi:hypothetical protein
VAAALSTIGEATRSHPADASSKGVGGIMKTITYETREEWLADRHSRIGASEAPTCIEVRDNASYVLAEQWVVEQVDGCLPIVVSDDTTIDIVEMESCDCIPVDVVDSVNRSWRLVSVQSVEEHGQTLLTATYRVSP